MRRSALLSAVMLAAGGCSRAPVNFYPSQWYEWESARTSPHLFARVTRADQVEANRECWTGLADLSAEALMVADRGHLSLLCQITDDVPLHQPRPARTYPRWWLRRTAGDAVDLVLHPRRGEPLRVSTGLGSAGVAPQIVDSQGRDSADVLPMPSGARLHLRLDLGARGLSAAQIASAEVIIHDVDGPADWSVHRTRLR
ncbi:MAG: hypothetical protein HUU25_01575 [Candidatus Sumerlaeia bacterium]|nr:hypothetical protein [Candidatus Sumerlaeia bacterium]